MYCKIFAIGLIVVSQLCAIALSAAIASANVESDLANVELTSSDIASEVTGGGIAGDLLASASNLDGVLQVSYMNCGNNCATCRKSFFFCN